MEMYLNVAMVDATPMLLQEFNQQAGIPSESVIPQPGFEVLNENGDYNWIPEDLFVKTHFKLKGLPFGIALEAAKRGRKISRYGWNGKDMFVVYSPGKKRLSAKSFWSEPLSEFAAQMGGQIDVRPTMLLKTAQGDIAYWAPSCSDTLAEDWYVL